MSEDLRQFELRSDDGEVLMTWLPEHETRYARIGSIISLHGETKRREVTWRGSVTIPRSEVVKKRFTNSATRDSDGRWIV